MYIDVSSQRVVSTDTDVSSQRVVSTDTDANWSEINGHWSTADAESNPMYTEVKLMDAETKLTYAEDAEVKLTYARAKLISSETNPMYAEASLTYVETNCR